MVLILINLRLKNILIIVLVLIFGNINAQVTNWQWAKTAPTYSADNCNSIANDPNGNVIITGSYGGTLGIVFGQYTLTGNGFYLTKYDPIGNVQWAKKANGNNAAVGNSLKIDNLGNSYVTGSFYSNAIFGTYTLSNPNGNAVFVAKFDDAGNVVWAKNSNGLGIIDKGQSLAIDKDKNIYVTGWFSGNQIVFDTYTLTNTGSNGYYDVFVVKYDSTGNVLWAKSAGGNTSDYGNSIDVDNNGNSYLTGQFNSSISFGTYTLVNSGGTSAYVVKFDPFGNVLWAKSVGENSYGNGIAISSSGKIYLTGYFGYTPIVFGTNTLTAIGGVDFFLLKYDELGNEVWAKSYGGMTHDRGTAISIDPNGKINAVGIFDSPTINFSTYTLTNNGLTNILISKFDSLGNCISADAVGGDSREYCSSVVAGANEELYIAGVFSSPSISFGSNTITKPGLANNYDIFIAKSGLSVGIKENQNKKENYQIIPNPSSGQFKIVFNGSKVKEVTIQSITGKIVYQILIYEDDFIDVNLSNLSKGLYFLNLKSEGATISKKLILH